MKVPLNWLKEFIDLNMAPTHLARVLTSLGIEVEGIEAKGPGFSKVVVGKVIAAEKHPNADKLIVAQVSDGNETVQVVCGAPNCRAGIKTAFALVGAEVGTGEGKIKVKKAKIRGVESFGMLCSGKELGISNEDDGIMEFQDIVKEGMDLSDLYSDTVLEVGLTPNLSHCLSILGIARELKASLNLKMKNREISFVEEGDAFSFPIEVKEKELCPRYTARIVEGVKVGPSPEWMVKRLEAAGVRSINNLVDITNYVMLETGQPLHAFDLGKLEGGLIVRKGQNEPFTTLDGKERVLSEDMLVIADKKKPLAIAGVMGGSNSEVGDETTRILIESAYFNPSQVRRTSKKLGLSTDSSKRFERGVDPNQAPLALDLAASLMQQLAGGKIQRGKIDIKAQEFEEKEIDFRVKRANKLLGTLISQGEMESIFERLGFKTQSLAGEIVKVKVPTYRVDVNEEIDLVEEVARIYGYDNIPRETPEFHGSRLPHSSAYVFENEVREKLISEGLQEFINADLVGPSALKIVSDKDPEGISVLNPVSIEQSILRTSLMPGLLQAVKNNFDRESRQVAGFEIGRIHYKDGDQYKEPSCVGIVLAGLRSPNPYDPHPEPFDFRDMKGILENFLESLGLARVSFRPSKLDALHPGRQAAIYSGGLEVGSFGEIHPQVARRLDVPLRILFAELNLYDLFKSRKKEVMMKPLPEFPASERDWTISLKEEAPVNQVVDAIKSIPSHLLEDVYLSDMYRSETIGPDKKNATFHFVYRDRNKTIEQAAVDAEHGRLIENALHLIAGCL